MVEQNDLPTRDPDVVLALECLQLAVDMLPRRAHQPGNRVLPDRDRNSSLLQRAVRLGELDKPVGEPLPERHQCRRIDYPVP